MKEKLRKKLNLEEQITGERDKKTNTGKRASKKRDKGEPGKKRTRKKITLLAMIAAVIIAVAVTAYFIVTATPSIDISYGNLKVAIDGYYVTTLGELIYGDYGYMGRVFYFLEKGTSADNLTADSKAFSVIVLPNQDEMWAVLNSIMEEAGNSPYSMTEMDEWYINVWDNWREGTTSVWAAQRGNVLVSSGHPISWEEFVTILRSIKGSALSLDPVKDSFRGLERMGLEVQYYEGYGKGGSEILVQPEETVNEGIINGETINEETNINEGAPDDDAAQTAAMDVITIAEDEPAAEIPADSTEETTENSTEEETDDFVFSNDDDRGDEEIIAEEQVPAFFEIGGSAIGVASMQVSFSTYDGYSQREMMQQFKDFMAEEFDPVVLIEDDNYMLVRAFFDIYDTGELVGYYRLVFSNHDALISVLWEVIARSYNGYEETDAAVISYIRQWKQNTNLVTALQN